MSAGVCYHGDLLIGDPSCWASVPILLRKTDGNNYLVVGVCGCVLYSSANFI